MHKGCLCRHAVSVCVCLSVTFVHCVKTNKDIFEFFSPLGSHNRSSFQFFLTKRDGDIPTRNPPPSNGDVECRWGRQKSRFWAYMPAVDAATGEVLSTWSPVKHGHYLASCDTYIAGRILRVFDQAPRAIISVVLHLLESFTETKDWDQRAQVRS